MTQILVDRCLIKEALANHELTKEALSKLASLELELRTAYAVIDLVSDGYLDPSVMREKIAAFADSPEDLRVFKKAMEMRTGNSLGTAVTTFSEQTKIASGNSAEDRLYSYISNLNSN